MTNGELFIKENPTVETKINGSCVWIYFDGVNHYTMPVEWWDKEISLFDKLRAKIEEPLKINEGMHTESAKAQAIALSWCIEIIDKYRNEVGS